MGICVSVTIDYEKENNILWFKERPRPHDILTKLKEMKKIDNYNYDVRIFTKYDIFDARYWNIKTLDLIEVKKIKK
jgi:hypothetical protein